MTYKHNIKCRLLRAKEWIRLQRDRVDPAAVRSELTDRGLGLRCIHDDRQKKRNDTNDSVDIDVHLIHDERSTLR